MLETALAAGICAMGGRVMLSGPIPTPAVAYLTTSMRADAGVVISASHNPFGDNGIKIFGPDGFKLADEKEGEIERLLESTELDAGAPPATRVGKRRAHRGRGGRYVVYCKSTFPEQLTLDGVRVVVDAAHGAAYKVAPAVFAELGADVIAHRRAAQRHATSTATPARCTPSTCVNEVVQPQARASASRSTATPTA